MGINERRNWNSCQYKGEEKEGLGGLEGPQTHRRRRLQDDVTYLLRLVTAFHLHICFAIQKFAHALDVRTSDILEIDRGNLLSLCCRASATT